MGYSPHISPPPFSVYLSPLLLVSHYPIAIPLPLCSKLLFSHVGTPSPSPAFLPAPLHLLTLLYAFCCSAALHHGKVDRPFPLCPPRYGPARPIPTLPPRTAPHGPARGRVRVLTIFLMYKSAVADTDLLRAGLLLGSQARSPPSPGALVRMCAHSSWRGPF